MGSGNTQNISFGGATFLGYALGSGTYVVNTDQSGSAANDLVAGDSAANVITGGDGNDLLFGGAGDDTISTTGTGSNLLVGGAGNDSLTGSDGNDWLSGGAGNDTMTGGAGSDTFIYYKGDGTDTVAGGTGASWTDLIELRDGGAALGTYGVDWTLSISSGSIISTDTTNEIITLSQDAAGTIYFNDGANISFTSLERVTW